MSSLTAVMAAPYERVRRELPEVVADPARHAPRESGPQQGYSHDTRGAAVNLMGQQKVRRLVRRRPSRWMRPSLPPRQPVHLFALIVGAAATLIVTVSAPAAAATRQAATNLFPLARPLNEGTLASDADNDAPQLRIVNGTVTSDHPTTGALLAYYAFPDSSVRPVLYCSGTLIGCHTFLTAAHCVADFPEPGAYAVFLQNAGTFGVSSITIHSDYPATSPIGDIAVLQLSTPVSGIAPTAINNAQSVALGTPGLIAGFGRTGGVNQDYGIKRAGLITTANCPAGTDLNAAVCWVFSAPLGAPGSNSNTCNGDSGGPLFVDFGSGQVVAGVTSSGLKANCMQMDNSIDTNVHFYRTFIEDAGGDDLGQPSCGALPQVGAAGTAVASFTGTLNSANPQAGFSFDVPAGTSLLRIALNGRSTISPYVDFDLYARAGNLPTPSTFDCGPLLWGSFEDCSFTNPTPGTWHVLVDRFSGDGDFQLNATLFGVPATATPTFASTATPTSTFSPTSSHTPSHSPTQTATPLPSETATPSPSDEATETPTAVPSSTPTATQTPTNSPAPTATPTDTATPTASPTLTLTPTLTPTPTPTATPVASETPTIVAPTPTELPTDTPVPTATTTPIATPTSAPPCTCSGDANRNGFVNFADFGSVQSHFGAPADPETGMGDANCNGFVNFADYGAVQANFGMPCP